MKNNNVVICLSFIAALNAANGIAKEKAPSQSTSPAVAAKYDTKLPVEISADSLEVLQRENKAIFKGNVIAVQGKIRLNADMMTVHYKQKDGKPPTPATENKSSGDMGAITHIEVDGHVLVVTPEESAEGDKGDYDVEKRFLHLTGENVILTREQNILRGKAVEYNLDTGHSILTNGPSTDSDKPKGDTRVRGVFVPKSTPKSSPR